jgi:hypothetical protein
MSHEALEIWRITHQDGILPTVNQNIHLPLLVNFFTQTGRKLETWSIEWDDVTNMPTLRIERKY